MQKIIFISGFILLSIALQAQNPIGIFTSTPSSCDGSISLDINGDACGDCELRLFKDRDPANDPDNPDEAQSVTNGSQATFNGLCAGTYDLVLYNADFDCYYYYDDPVVIEVCNISIVSTAKEDENCGDDGSITVNISDNHPSYTYELIKNGSIVQTDISDDLSYTFNNLSDGFYTVKVRNSGGCEISLSGIQIVEGDNSLSIDNVTTTSNECEFSNDGSITLDVSGGNGSYFYNWGAEGSSGGSPFTITDLAPDVYSITVSSEGCSAVTTAEVGVEQGGNCNPPMGDCDGFSVDLTHNCDKFIILTATPNEGTPPYTYLWTEDGVEIGTDSSIDAGAVGPALDNVQYCVEVSDSASLCTTNSCITAYEMYNNCYGGNGNSNVENRSNNVLSKFILTATPNPFGGNLSIVLSSPTNQQVTIDIIDINGRSIYQVELDLIKGENLKKIDASNWSSGIYQIVVREANGTMNVKKVVRID